jgi:hypothetical protein
VLRQLPGNLSHFIELANSYLPEVNRHGRPSAYSLVGERRIIRRYRATMEGFRDSPLRLLLRLPLFPGAPRPGVATASSISEMHEAIRVSLREVARAAAQLPKEGTRIQLHDPVMPWTQVRLSGSGRIELSDPDPLAKVWTDLLQSLNGCEAKRIRICPVCENLYWAARITRPACSKECNNTRRQRELREKLSLLKRAEIARQRRAERVGD